MIDELKADLLACKAIIFCLTAEMDRSAIVDAAKETIRTYSRLPDPFNDKACQAVEDILM